MFDILGFTSIALVILLTLIIALRCPGIFKIIFVALIIRLIFLFIGHYITPLPDSTADAITFNNAATVLAKEGFYYIITNFNGPDLRWKNYQIISWIIAIPYSLLGTSLLMAKSISLLFGIGSVFLGWLVANKMWNKSIADKVGWTMALFPSFILYSVITMREQYIVFFIILALYGVVNWFKTENFTSIILAITGFIGATMFHGAMFVGCIAFLGVIGILNIKKFFKSLILLRLNVKIFFFLLFFLISSGFYLTSKITIPYLGSFENSINIDLLLRKTNFATRGDAAWPAWTIISSPIELFYKAPLRSLYIVYSPFPWDVSKLKHLIGMFDAFLYMYLTFLIYKNRKVIWKDPTLRIILIILLSYIFVFGIGVGNFGTGIRHRSKFAIMFILLAAPLIKTFILSKVTKKT